MWKSEREHLLAAAVVVIVALFCYLRCFLGLNFLCISNYLMDFNIQFFADLLLLYLRHHRCHTLFIFKPFEMWVNTKHLFWAKSILIFVKHAYIIHIKCACHMILSPVVAIIVVIVVVVVAIIQIWCVLIQSDCVWVFGPPNF